MKPKNQSKQKKVQWPPFARNIERTNMALGFEIIPDLS